MSGDMEEELEHARRRRSSAARWLTHSVRRLEEIANMDSEELEMDEEDYQAACSSFEKRLAAWDDAEMDVEKCLTTEQLDEEIEDAVKYREHAEEVKLRVVKKWRRKRNSIADGKSMKSWVSGRMPPHKPGHVVLIFICMFVMFAMFAMNGLNNGDIIPGLYINGDMAALTDKYYIEITPAGATFSIWGAIYFWQVLFIAYGLSTICRLGPDGYLYYSPGIMPSGIYWSYIINNVLNISWLILFDREIMIGGLVVIALMWLTLIIPLGISHKAVTDNLEVLRKNGLMREAWLIRFLVQNAHAFYVTWVTVATLLNLAIVLTYDVGLDQSLSSTIALGILGGEILLWLILDFFVLPKYTNYLFSPYIVLPVALGGSLAKNMDLWATNTIITVALLGVAFLALIIKIILMIVRHCRNKNNEPIESTLEKTQSPQLKI